MNTITIGLIKAIPAMAYFITWLVFGYIYRNEANATAGAAFIFQEDLKNTSIIQAFETKTGFDVPDEYIKAILSGDDIKERNIGGFSSSEINRLALFSDTPLGDNWAKYYIAALESQEVTHFSASVETDRDVPIAFLQGTTPVRLTLYRGPKPEGNIRIIDINPDPKAFQSFREYYLLVQGQPKIPTFADGTRIQFVPAILAHSLLAKSMVFPDDQFFVLRDVAEGKYEYPLTDFLYFSAVTITTLGYGDILPASSNVRRLVMIEALLGIFLAGLFISALFWTPSRTDEMVNEKKSSELEEMDRETPIDA